MLRGAIWNVLRVVVTVPLFLWLARTMTGALGDDSRGAWAIFGILWLQPALFDLGLGEALTRRIARVRGHRRERARSVAWGLLLFGALTLLLAVAYLSTRGWLAAAIASSASVASAAVAPALDLAALALLAGVLTWAMTRILVGFERYGLVAMLHLVTVVLFVGFALWQLPIRPELRVLGQAAALASGATLAGSALAVFVLLRTTPEAEERAPPLAHPLAELLRTAPLFYVSAISGLVETVVGRMLLGVRSPAAARAVGYLDNATEVAYRLRAVPHLVAAPVYPAVASAGTVDEVGALYRDASRRNILLAAPLLLGGVFFARPFVELWLGNLPDEAGDASLRIGETSLALSVLCLAAFLQVLYVPAFHVWNGMGRVLPGAIASLLSAAVQLGVIVSFVDELGLRAVLIAPLAAHGLAALLFLAWFHRAQGLSLARTYLHEIHPPLASMVACAGLGRILLERQELTWITFLATCAGVVCAYAGILAFLAGDAKTREQEDEADDDPAPSA